MRLKTAALLASVWLASSGAALGQVDLGNEVTVHPIQGGGGVLLYPGGQYMRVVPSLLQPGQNPRDTGVIHLHMLGKHRAVARTQTASSLPGYQPLGAPVAAPPKRTRAPRPAPPAAASSPDMPGYNSGFGPAAGAAGLGGALTPAAPATRLAKAEPAPTTTPSSQEAAAPGLTKRSVILFAPDASDPAQTALGAIKFLAGDLNAAMTGPAARIQILAFGGARGDKGSDARRLSLKRALAIRQVLIDDGVSADRIDVRAMGGTDDSGPADRVDVYIKT